MAVIMNISLHSNCRVQLTKAGAEYMNNLNNKANDVLKELFVNPSVMYEQYKPMEYFYGTIVFISEIYLKMQELGLDSPFIFDTIEVLTKEVIASCKNDKEN